MLRLSNEVKAEHRDSDCKYGADTLSGFGPRNKPTVH
jgi:hypothetical protein